MAAAALIADRSWHLTGTYAEGFFVGWPVVNGFDGIKYVTPDLGDVFQWNNLVQKPFEEGNEKGLKLVQSILRPGMKLMGHLICFNAYWPTLHGIYLVVIFCRNALLYLALWKEKGKNLSFVFPAFCGHIFCLVNLGCGSFRYQCQSTCSWFQSLSYASHFYHLEMIFSFYNPAQDREKMKSGKVLFSGDISTRTSGLALMLNHGRIAI
ncbi:hypothetical protein Vadar_004664 [Vaccinium darrowii]|uniref:Uncharacterized protein n=1 Tax=Vaccinium darrowii TaxID=229202 RepID=A0ACB7YJP6_9ERIC|nr:hypothetical protein Vadar_004664 [Vaccinium darrowii]